MASVLQSEQVEQWLRQRPSDGRRSNSVDASATSEDANPWIRWIRSTQRSFSQSEESEEFVPSPMPVEAISIDDKSREKVVDKAVEEIDIWLDDLKVLKKLREEKEEEISNPQKRKHGGANLEHLIKLFLAPNSKYLRLDSALNSLNLPEKEATQKGERALTSSNNTSSNSDINSNRRNSSSRRRISSVADRSFLLPSVSMSSDQPYQTAASSEEIQRLGRQSIAMVSNFEEKEHCSSNMRANLSHFNDILSAPLVGFIARQSEPEPESRISSSFEEMRVPPAQMMVSKVISDEHSMEDFVNVSANDFITLQSQSEDGRVESKTFIQPADTLAHMSFLQNNPNEVFLVQRKRKSTMEESDMCAWLRGVKGKNSEDECRQCNGLACDSKQRLERGWIKTASDW